MSDNYLRFASSDKIKSLINWSSSTVVRNLAWGIGEEIILCPTYGAAGTMEVKAFCGNMDFVAIYIVLSRYHLASSARYKSDCFDIFSHALNRPGFELINVDNLMCLGFGINWESVTQSFLCSRIEELAKLSNGLETNWMTTAI